MNGKDDDHISYSFKAICSNKDWSSSHKPSFCKILTQKLENMNVKNLWWDGMNLIVMLHQSPSDPFLYFSHLQTVAFSIATTCSSSEDYFRLLKILCPAGKSPRVPINQTLCSVGTWKPIFLTSGWDKPRVPLLDQNEAYVLWDLYLRSHPWMASPSSLSAFPTLLLVSPMGTSLISYLQRVFI